MISLIEDMKGSHPGRVKLVLSSTPKAAGIAKAISKGIKTRVVDFQAFENNNLAFEEVLNKELKKYDISVCMSYHEGLPRIVVESLYIGLYTLSNNLPGIRNIFDENENGVLIMKNNLTQFYDEIIKITN